MSERPSFAAALPDIGADRPHSSDPARVSADMETMPLLLVACDGQVEEAQGAVDPAAFEAELEAYPAWARLHRLAWLIRTHDDPARVVGKLTDLAGGSVRIVVVDVSDRVAWNSVLCGGEWLHAHLPPSSIQRSRI